MSDLLRTATPEQLEAWADEMDDLNVHTVHKQSTQAAAALLRAVARVDRKNAQDAEGSGYQPVWVATLSNEHDEVEIRAEATDEPGDMPSTLAAALASLLETPE